MNIMKILLISLGLIPIIALFDGKVSSILIFSIFVFLYLWKGLQRYLARIPLPLWFLYIFWGTLFGAVTQVFVQLEGFEKAFSADPLIHLLQALTIYFSLTVIWYLILKRYAFSLKYIFTITGLWGVVVEGLFIYGSISPFVWLFLFVVYGSYASIAYLLTAKRFGSMDRKTPTIKMGFVAFFVLFLALVMSNILIAGGYLLREPVSDTNSVIEKSSTKTSDNKEKRVEEVYIGSLSPSSGPVGTKVTISGQGFAPRDNVLVFGFGIGSKFFGISSDESRVISFVIPEKDNPTCPDSKPCPIRAPDPILPGEYNVSITNTNGSSNTKVFTVTGS